VGTLRNRLGALRERRGLRQRELAEAVGVSRQSLSALEAGRSAPSTDLALRLARALDCRVDDLFWLEERETSVVAELAGGGDDTARGGRVALAWIDGRWVAHRLAIDAGSVAADGLLARRGGAGRRHRVGLLRPVDELRDGLVCAGCAPALGLLAARAGGHRGGPRVVWLERSSGDALGLLQRGHAQVAGAHLFDDASGAYNVPVVQRLMPDRAMRVFRLARWQAGLVVAAGNPRRIAGAADLASPDVAVLRREPGSGAEALLARMLRDAGVAPGAVRRGPLVRGHLEVARAVALGAADAGVAIESVALGLGLGFVPLAEERFDLVVARDVADDPRVVRLLDTLTGRAFRRDLDSLGGYQTAEAGDLIVETRAQP